LGKEVFDLLLQGANPNITDLEGDTPLHVALNGQNGFVLDVITSLLSFGANPFLTNSEGCSSIHYAATYGNNNQMSIILDISSNFYPAPSDLELLGAVNNE